MPSRAQLVTQLRQVVLCVHLVPGLGPHQK